MESTLKAIFFDIGGVLVRVDSSRAINELSGTLQVSPETIREAMSVELLHKYEKGSLSSNQFYENLLMNCDSSAHMDLETFKAYWQDVLFPLPESIAFMERLKTSYPLWLLSNTNDFHYDLLMASFPFMQWAAGGTYSFKVGSMKPEPAIYQHALSNAGFAPQDVLFIDDLLVNVQAARDLGMHAVQFTGWDQFSRSIRASFPELEDFL